VTNSSSSSFLCLVKKEAANEVLDTYPEPVRELLLEEVARELLCLGQEALAFVNMYIQSYSLHEREMQDKVTQLQEKYKDLQVLDCYDHSIIEIIDNFSREVEEKYPGATFSAQIFDDNPPTFFSRKPEDDSNQTES